MTDNLENYHKAPVPTCKAVPNKEIPTYPKNPAIEDNEQDWEDFALSQDEVIQQRDFHQELAGRANENIIACERALRAAKYYTHRCRLAQYKEAVQNGLPQEVGRASYQAAMQNYDAIIDLAFKGRGGGEHNDECVKRGWDDEE